MTKARLLVETGPWVVSAGYAPSSSGELPGLSQLGPYAVSSSSVHSWTSTWTRVSADLNSSSQSLTYSSSPAHSTVLASAVVTVPGSRVAIVITRPSCSRTG